jgi:hypothetical protein
MFLQLFTEKNKFFIQELMMKTLVCASAMAGLLVGAAAAYAGPHASGVTGGGLLGVTGGGKSGVTGGGKSGVTGGGL